LAERLGYDTVCIDDLVAAVRAVTTVASHPKIHAMTEIDYREYYIQNIAETTPDAAGSRMNRDFYRGASDEEALITKFVERSARYNGRSSTPQG
jgi:ketopantoate reductase